MTLVIVMRWLGVGDMGESWQNVKRNKLCILIFDGWSSMQFPAFFNPHLELFFLKH